MINALHREKHALEKQLEGYKVMSQTIYVKKMIVSTKIDIEIVEEWEKQVQEGIRLSERG